MSSRWIKIVVQDKDLDPDADIVNMTRVVTYYPVISDGVHGVNVASSGDPAATSEAADLVAGPELVRGNIKMSGMAYIDTLKSGAGVCIEV